MIGGHAGVGADAGELSDALIAHASEVRSFVERRNTSSMSPDDLVQETWARAIRGEVHRDPHQPVLPWLIAIARNVCRDASRRDRRIDLVALESIVDPVLADEAGDALVAHARRQLIREVFTALPGRQRRALVRHEIDGAPYLVIAAEEGASVESIRALIRRGRSEFRQRYVTLAERRGLLGGVVLPFLRRLRSIGAIGSAAAGAAALLPVIAGVALFVRPPSASEGHVAFDRIPMTRAAAEPGASATPDARSIRSDGRNDPGVDQTVAERDVELSPVGGSAVKADVDVGDKSNPSLDGSLRVDVADAWSETKIATPIPCDGPSIIIGAVCAVLALTP